MSVDHQLKALLVLLNHLTDPSELSLAREAYHAIGTGEARFWLLDRPQDVARLRAIFERVFNVPEA
jgi:hypothetical protein